MEERRIIPLIKAMPDEPGVLEQYATIDIAFTVVSRLAVRPIRQGIGGLLLVEEAVSEPYLKDYDAHEPPTRWRKTFDLTQWTLLMAFDRNTLIGGAVVAWDTPGLDMLEGRDDLAVLWDLRVHPDYRRRGVGQDLMRETMSWAGQRGCRFLKVETQNVNVPACRFYAHQGFELRTIYSGAYVEFPEEVQLLWYKTLCDP